MSKAALIIVVEDDESVRESLPDLLNEFGYTARAFTSAEELMACDALTDASCLILEIGLPGMSGPDLQRELIRRGIAIPIIFITGCPDRNMPDVLAQGAIACLVKPFSERELRAVLDLAMGSLPT